MNQDDLKKWALRKRDELRVKHGVKDAKDQFPTPGQRVLATYSGVYADREVTFWFDAGGNPHFGLPDEADGKGSQPATTWRALP